MKQIFLFLVLMSSMVFAQDILQIPQRGKRGQKEVSMSTPDTVVISNTRQNIPYSYTTVKYSIRTVIGFQKAAYVSLGIAKTGCSIGCTGFAFGTYYAALAWNSVPNDDVYGVTIGGEYTVMGLAVGLESTYQSNFKDNDVAITPKIGLGVCNFNIFYGYTISLARYPFQGLGKHRVAIVYYF